MRCLIVQHVACAHTAYSRRNKTWPVSRKNHSWVVITPTIKKKKLDISVIVIYNDAPYILCHFSQTAEHGFHLVVKYFFLLTLINRYAQSYDFQWNCQNLSNSSLLSSFIVLSDLASQWDLLKFNSPSFFLISERVWSFFLQKCL